jgi:hypothetical protein
MRLRTIIGASLLLAIATSLSLGAGVALAASCSGVGITKPTVGSGHIDAPSSTGNCTVSWYTEVIAQYESGGTWHNAPSCNDLGSCLDLNPADCTTFPSGSQTFNDYWDSSRPLSCANAGDVDTAALPGGQSLCAFNWRIHAQLINASNNNTIVTQDSSQTNSTC